MSSHFSALRFWGALSLLILLAISTRFWALEYPREVVFDEYHFFRFVENYEKGEYFFDIHPPLGKLLLWAGARTGNFSDVPRSEDLDSEWSIGTAYHQDLELFWVRFLPALFGVLLIPTIFLLLFFTTKSVSISFFGSLLATFETSLITESQYVLMDSSLLFFCTLALLFLLLFHKAAREWQKWIFWILVSFSCAFAISIKWTGLSIIGLAGIVLIIELWNAQKIQEWKIQKNISLLWSAIATFFLRAIVFWGITAAIYIGVFAVHFEWLPKSGPGDAFHSLEFQATLEDNRYAEDYEPMGFWGKFYELNTRMFERNKSISSEHPYASKWYQWVIAEKPVFYWHEDAFADERKEKKWVSWLGISERMQDQSYGSAEAMNMKFEQKIFLFGNPVVWWGATIAVLVSLCIVILGGRKNKNTTSVILFLLLAYGVNVLPFAVVERPAFLYHYLNALIISILLFALITQYIKPKILRNTTLVTISIFAILTFISVSPLVYGTPLRTNAFSEMMYW